MPRQKTADGAMSFSGGLNVQSDAASLGDTQMRRSDNARLIDRGAVTKRQGTQRLHTTALPASVRGLTTWRRSSGAAMLCAVAAGTFYTASYPTLPTPATWTQQGSTGALATTDVIMAAFRDGTAEALYLADGVGLSKWTGTTLTAHLASTPAVTYIWIYNQRLFGVDGATSTLYWSALNNGDSLGQAGAGGGSAVVRTFGESKLVAGSSYGPANLLFHSGGISVFTGYTQDDISIGAGTAGLSQTVGTSAPRSVRTIDEGVFFVSDQGCYLASFRGVTALDTPDTPDPTGPVLAQLSSTDLARVQTVVNRATKEVWIWIPTRGCYVWHTVLRAWSGPWDTAYLATDVSAFATSVDALGKPCVLKGDPLGYVSRCDAPGIGTDDCAATTTTGRDGTAFTMAWSPRRLYPVDAQGNRDLTATMRLRRVRVTADLRGSTTAQIAWLTSTTGGIVQLTTGNAPLGGGAYDDPMAGYDDTTAQYDGGGMRQYTAEVGGTGTYVDLTLTDSGTSPGVYAGVQLEASLLGRNR